MKRSIMVFAVCVLTFVGAGVYASPKQDSPMPASQTPPAAKSSQADSLISGKVAETMDSGGYTYINLDQSGKKRWIAIPLTQVKVGQQVTLQPGVEMGSFTSKTLSRTFDSIVFSGGIVSNPSGGGAAKPVMAQQAGSTSPVKKPAEKIKVEKAAGPDSYTVSEVFEKQAALNEKTAVVKGKVVKVSQGIMGKNWIHLQDGTGDAVQGTNKLVTTSQDLPTIGDIVTMKGTIYKDKDFGSGYKYNVIMEKATMQK